MECFRNDDGTWRVFMRPDELEAILNSTIHHSCRIAILLMALSLRRGTTVEVTPGDFYRENGVWWLHVEGKDASGRYHETKPRSVWIPEPIMAEIKSYINEKDLGEDDPLFDIGKRQLNNWVQDTVENTAQRTGNENFERVSPHDFRRFFAVQFLFRLGADEQLVLQLGGWKTRENMLDYLLMPSLLRKNYLDEAGLLGSNPLKMTGFDSVERIERHITSARSVMAEADDDTVTLALAKTLSDLANDISGLTVTIAPDAIVDNEDEDDEDDDLQTSFNSLDVGRMITPLGAIVLGGVGFGRRVHHRLKRELAVLSPGIGTDEIAHPSVADTGRATAAYAGMVGLTGFLLGSVGVTIDPATMTSTASASTLSVLGAGLAAGTVRTLVADYCDRIGTPSIGDRLRQLARR